MDLLRRTWHRIHLRQSQRRLVAVTPLRLYLRTAPGDPRKAASPGAAKRGRSPPNPVERLNKIARDLADQRQRCVQEVNIRTRF